MFPRVSILYSNGNLLRDIAAVDGICGLVATAATVGMIGVVKQVFNLADAVEKGYTEAAEPFIYRHLKEFYAEVGGNQELWVLGVADTMTMAGALDGDDPVGAIKLIRESKGVVRVLGIARKPSAGYDGGAGFIDSDVQAAVLASKTFCEARLAELIPLRVLVEGRVIVANEDSNDIYHPTDSEIDFAGVVLGGSQNDGSASVGAALGRVAKYPAHIKIGKVANGPLALSTGPVYVGTKELSQVLNLETLHGYGYISFMQHPGKAGVYFGIDRMANTKDYRLLVYGRVVDKAAIITAAVYVEELEGEVNVNPDGTMDELEIEHLKGVLKQNVDNKMSDQYSAFEVLIDPKQDVTNTSKIQVKARVQPKGYKSFIDVDLGLNAPGA